MERAQAGGGRGRSSEMPSSSLTAGWRKSTHSCDQQAVTRDCSRDRNGSRSDHQHEVTSDSSRGRDGSRSDQNASSRSGGSLSDKFVGANEKAADQPPSLMRLQREGEVGTKGK